MIITRSPLRISFAGGGTDVPAFYQKYGPGVVVSTSINKYVYVTLNEKFDGKVSIRYREHEIAEASKYVKHPLIRECLLKYEVTSGIEIVIISEVPARGSGLGASSALACALCLALEKFTNRKVSEWTLMERKKRLAERAARIEIFRCQSPIGKQDHYASAIGGLNMLQFNADESVEVLPYSPDDFYYEIESQSMLFYLNIEHTYIHPYKNIEIPDRSFVPKILHDQIYEMPEKNKIHILQRDNALSLWQHMEYGVPERFIDHVNENWRLKRSTHEDITNEEIDKIIERSYAKGATAAKVCGAGGGGFLYLMVPSSMQQEVRKEFEGELHELIFKFDKKGSDLVFSEEREHASCKD